MRVRPVWLGVAVAAMLIIHVGLASLSLVRENPTIDEVAHLPAGITYWQKGTFRLYAQNPPLVKLIAALPVVWARPVMDRIYERPSWRQNVHASIAHEFAVDNAERYFELFTLARLVIPWFSVIGGLVVFAWSRRLYGDWGGLLSLTLWCICPNVLAHSRLVTTDVGATALGVLATWLFWRYTRSPSWRRAGLAGIGLGLAVLAKFSNLLLFGIWPLIWAAGELARLLGGSTLREGEPSGEPRWAWRLPLAVGQGGLMVAVALFVINLGYGFEGTFRPLGKYEFASGALTVPRSPGRPAPVTSNELQTLALRLRVNRFRDTLLGPLPAPLPVPFLEGFDLQKLDAEGLPERFVDPLGRVDPTLPEGTRVGYPVYLDGELRSRGWWYYYLAALAYKVPGGTWVLGLLSLGVLVGSRRSRAAWADEFAVAAVPITVLLAMSFGTDINLGLRYVLPAFPYAFIAMGKVAPWVLGLAGRTRRVALTVVAVCLVETVIATALVHPHYLAYFNWASGGPDHGSEHLIDSNLDWGQDLVTLRDWLKANHPGERVGLAYFGQINPNILRMRDEGFDWFLPPPLPGTIRPLNNPARLDGPLPRLEPGLYAVSASFVRGLPYAIYDPSPRVTNLYPGWDSRGTSTDHPTFGYFAGLSPEAKVGYSIFVYRVTPEQAARLAPLWEAP